MTDFIYEVQDFLCYDSWISRMQVVSMMKGDVIVSGVDNDNVGLELDDVLEFAVVLIYDLA